jgi:hypothetical protein
MIISPDIDEPKMGERGFISRETYYKIFYPTRQVFRFARLQGGKAGAFAPGETGRAGGGLLCR